MKVECQSCFVDVIPMADGHCPACNGLLDGKDGAMTKVTVFERDRPAEICMRCGAAASAIIRIRRKARNHNYQPTATSRVDANPLALLFNLVAGKYHQKVEVAVPICASCRSSGPGEPLYVDYELRSMTFVGHRTWRESVERERKTSKG